MTYETYRYIFIGAILFAVVMLIVAIILFFLLRIPTVIGDLTGVNARKAIEDIRNRNESGGAKTYRSSNVNKERGRLTDKITESGRIERRNSGNIVGAMMTEKIATQQLLRQSQETNVLGNGTTLLSNETTILNQVNENVTETLEPRGTFEIEYEITFIHSDEMVN